MLRTCSSNKVQFDFLPIPSLDCDCIGLIFQYIYSQFPGGLLAPALVNKHWRKITNDIISTCKIDHFQKITFGPQHWGTFLKNSNSDKEIQAVYSILPNDIANILNRPCPFFGDKTVKETHMLMYLPAKILTQKNGQRGCIREICLPQLTLLAKDWLPKFNSNYENWPGYAYLDEYDKSIIKDLHMPVDVAHWILMLKTPVPEYVERFRKLGYKYPNTVEATAAIITHYLRSKEFLFHDEYTICKDEFSDTPDMIVGGFNLNGLDIDFHWFAHKKEKNIGIAPLLRFHSTFP